MTVVALVIGSIGVLFACLAAIGLITMPDLYTRLHAAAKAATLGAACTLIAAALHFGHPGSVIKALLAVVFLFFTAPIAAHLIARAGYLSGIRPTEAVVDDWAKDFEEEEPAETEKP